MPQFTVPRPTNVTRPLAKGYDVLFGEGATGIYARLMPQATNPLQRVTQPPTPPAFRTEANPEDFGDSDGSRTFSRNDFEKGQGLDLAHQRDLEERDFGRFWDSRNIEIARPFKRAARGLRLHPDTGLIEGISGGNSEGAVFDGSLFWIDPSTQVLPIRRTDNPLDPSPTIVGEDPHAGQGNANIKALVVSGEYLYTSRISGTNNGTHRRDTGGTWTDWSDFTAEDLWAAKGRVLGSAGATFGDDLYELAAGAGSTLLAATAGKWSDVIDGGPAIVGAVKLENGSELYSWADDGGTLTLVAETPVPGDHVEAMAQGGGSVFYVTTEVQGGFTGGRLWRASFDASFGLADRQLIWEWEGNPLAKMLSTRDSVYMWVSEQAPIVSSHLWRYDLATAALHRVSRVAFGGANDEGNLLAYGDKIIGVSQAGVYRQEATYQTDGYLITPLVDFFTAEDKRWTSVRVWAKEVPTDTQVDLYYSTDPAAIEDPSHGSWTLVETLTAGELGGDEVALGDNVSGRWAALKVELASNPAQTSTPVVQSVAVRAYPTADEAVYDLPINISDHINRPRRRRIFARGYGEQMWAQIKALEGKTMLVELLRPNEKIRGVVESVSMPIQHAAERGSRTTMCTVRVRGRKE